MLRHPRLALSLDLGALLALYALAWGITRLPLYALHPELLSVAVAFDLIVTAAGIHWALGVRSVGLPSWTISLVALAGALCVAQLVPAVGAPALILGLLALVELALGGVVLWRGAALVRRIRLARRAGADRLGALEDGLAEALESRLVAAAAVTELQILTLGLFGIFRPTPQRPGAFTMHQIPGWIPLVASLVFLISPAEVIVAHALIEAWAGAGPAWIVTGLTLYGLLWLWGDAQAMRLHPTTVEGGVLHLRIGLRWRAQIALSDVLEISDDPHDALDLTLLGEPSLVLVLSQPVQITGPLGLTRSSARLALQLDRPDAFAQRVLDEPRR